GTVCGSSDRGPGARQHRRLSSRRAAAGEEQEACLSGLKTPYVRVASMAAVMAGDVRVRTLDRRPVPRRAPQPRPPPDREPPAAPAARRPAPPDAQTPTSARPRQALLAGGRCVPAGLAPSPRARPPRDGGPLAPPGVAAVLAVEVARATRPPAPERRDPG